MAAQASNYYSQLEQLVMLNNKRLQFITAGAAADIISNIEHERTNFAKKVHDCKPDTFAGNEDPIELENWFRQIEKILEAVECPEDQKVSRAAFYLKEEADYWWATAQEGFRAQPNFNWEAFKTALRSRFYPAHVRARKFLEFMNLKQGNNDSLTDYYKKFVELWRCVNVMRDEERKVVKFISGMNFDLQRHMPRATYPNLHEAYDAAVEVERLLEKSGSSGTEGGNGDTTRGNQNGAIKRSKPYVIRRK